MNHGKSMTGIHAVEGPFPDNCTGCRTCELVCSMAHEGVVNSEKSRIHVRKDERYGFSYPVACTQCADPECAKVCPVGSIRRQDDVVAIDEGLCVACEMCVAACPSGAIRMHPLSGKAFKCDLCGGSPQCIEWCPRKILRLRRHRHDQPDSNAEALLTGAIAELNVEEP